jgi:hypothetical protein
MKYLFFIIIISTNALSQIEFSQNLDNFSTKEIEKLAAPKLSSFAQASHWADLVAIAQVDDIEYKQVRKLNAKGYAFLNILVPYKGASRGESIAVIATGFDENVCYYPDRVNEGERFLVFLKKAPDEESNVYYGFKPYCQFQILLSKLGQYILRTPLDSSTIKLDESIIEEHTFNDPHAMFDTTLWTSIKREDYADKYQCKIIEDEDKFNKKFFLRYTQGIPLYKVRKLLKIKYKPKRTSNQI